jgi:hypothetical protein
MDTLSLSPLVVISLPDLVQLSLSPLMLRSLLTNLVVTLDLTLVSGLPILASLASS